MNDIVDASQSSTLELQEQIDLYKEKNRRELTELQKLLKERGVELEKHLLTSKTLQEEVPRSPRCLFSAATACLKAESDVRGVKSTPSLVTVQMMSFCSDSTSSAASLHHPLFDRNVISLVFAVPHRPH